LFASAMAVLLRPRVRFEQGLGVGPVGLVALAVPAHVLSRQQPHAVVSALDLPRPEVSGATGLEQHRRRWPLREEPRQCRATQTLALGDPYATARNRHLEDRLCQVDSDRRTLSHGLLLSRIVIPMTPTTVALQMPIKSGEESISSFERTARGAVGSLRSAARVWAAAQLTIR